MKSIVTKTHVDAAVKTIQDPMSEETVSRLAVEQALEEFAASALGDYHGPEWERTSAMLERGKEIIDFFVTDRDDHALLLEINMALALRSGMVIGAEAGKDRLRSLLGQMSRIALWQATPGVHPFTCGNSSTHRVLVPLYNEDLDRVTLRCLDCDYVQINIPAVVR